MRCRVRLSCMSAYDFRRSVGPPPAPWVPGVNTSTAATSFDGGAVTVCSYRNGAPLVAVEAAAEMTMGVGAVLV